MVYLKYRPLVLKTKIQTANDDDVDEGAEEEEVPSFLRRSGGSIGSVDDGSASAAIAVDDTGESEGESESTNIGSKSVAAGKSNKMLLGMLSIASSQPRRRS